MTDARVAVVVATRDRPELLEGCLSSLRAALRDGDELVVVDSASRAPAGTRDLAVTYDARYVRCDEPGASLARNIGWQAADAGIVAFIDDDTRVRAGWADAVAAALSSDGGPAFVTGRLEGPEEHRERPVAVFDLDEGFAISKETDEPYGHGANHAVARAALERIGGFDERLGAGGEFRAAEDLDLWDRLLQAGYLGAYVPEMVAWHVQWRRRRNFVGLDWSYGFGGGVRLSKLVRVDRRRGLHSMRLFLWNWGLHLTGRHLYYRQYFLAAITLVRLGGVFAGFTRGIVVAVDDGHLAPKLPRGARPRGGPPDDRR
jgi:GT2 family glycosyltransferase